jgi:hypothetical protein
MWGTVISPMVNIIIQNLPGLCGKQASRSISMSPGPSLGRHLSLNPCLLLLPVRGEAEQDRHAFNVIRVG